MASHRWPVHIEVRLKPTSTARFDTISELVKELLEQDETLYIPSVLSGWETHRVLRQNVEIITASESSCPSHVLPVGEAILEIHIYQPSQMDSSEDWIGGRLDGDDLSPATVCDLPNGSLEGVWDSLVYEDEIKPRLLNYIYATLLFSDADVDSNIVAWNRVVLLHGPPGTGKTSLCRALAQKLSIRLSSRYAHSKLVEINSHSLFSKWFSESGKLVGKLFANITDLVDDDTTFVVVLIDEVESLTAARTSAMSGNEPSDAIRVVNALLTQLDKLKHRKNVLIMSTSNLTQAIDSAYIDRADIVQYVGLPAQSAIYSILRTCLLELVRVSIITSVDILDAKQAEADVRTVAMMESEDEDGGTGGDNEGFINQNRSRRVSVLLWILAGKCKGMSGRSLRRLPVLAQARHIGVSAANWSSAVPSANGGGARRGGASDVEVWLSGMERIVDQESQSRAISGRGDHGGGIVEKAG
ncbi:hypothetical protein BS47DRAFT_1336978 [Hydnum rufescens UP504]|uniref:AAA+ ATPase domain-containing protein n=1 Tax=Hydnum rufescens UP504 TaxID=1448309 RepID=A0A9P6B951_9AGAM|nr:hypothetical protein BS47DRAFT_1336978 [Hydnum rufescens UP504]